MPTKDIYQLQAGDKIGPYTVLQRISNGGMAWVCRVRLGDNDQLALKISRMRNAQDENANTALRKEAELLQTLEHKRVVRIFPIHDDNRRAEGRRDFYAARALNLDHHPWYFVMEHLSGGTVQNYIKSLGKPLTAGEAANIAGNVALALHYMHSKGLSHNDVKPDNVLFRTPPRNGARYDPVLIDFGIAANASKQPGAASLYISPPERVRKIKGMDAPETPEDPGKPDTWAVGVLLYYMLTTAFPFPALAENTLTSQILTKDPSRPRDLNPRVPAALSDFVVDYCLAKEPIRRASMLDVINFLKPYGAGERGRVCSAKQ